MLSNLLIPRVSRVLSTQATIRHAELHEIEPALRLVLATDRSGPSESYLQEFIAMAQYRGMPLRSTWVAEQNGAIVTALLPVISPGRTMLIFAPSYLPRPELEPVLEQMIDHACQQARAADVHLAQALFDPRYQAIQRVFLLRGFTRMAELFYLQAAVPRRPKPAPLEAGMMLETYSEYTHAQFAQAIMASYQDSLDCPALNGLREIDDVIEGHKASGEFDSRLWFLLKQQDQPLGVLLLNPGLRSQGVELVYLGLTPQARGRGVGTLLMRHALHTAQREGLGYLSLAVDAANEPALRLYYRHGLQRICSRHALIQNLRQARAETVSSVANV